MIVVPVPVPTGYGAYIFIIAFPECFAPQIAVILAAVRQVLRLRPGEVTTFSEDIIAGLAARTGLEG